MRVERHARGSGDAFPSPTSSEVIELSRSEWSRGPPRHLSPSSNRGEGSLTVPPWGRDVTHGVCGGGIRAGARVG
jgi:hypothetical protein